MKTEKNLGIWMDHSVAHIMEFLNNYIIAQTIESKFTYEEKLESLERSERITHNKEKHEQSEYYKKLGVIIKDYDNVILFGPTTAKTELFNLLKSDHLFSKINIEIKQTDKMTENQQHAFVREHFDIEHN